jgi:hypothetical protein
MFQLGLSNSFRPNFSLVRFLAASARTRVSPVQKLSRRHHPLEANKGSIAQERKG